MSEVQSYAVIGLGVFGSSVARTLAAEGIEVMAIDSSREIVNGIASEVTYALQVDVTNEAAMKNIGLERMDGAVIAIGDKLQASVMATILCKEMKIPKIIAKAKTDLEKRILERVGADEVILPEKESGYRLAKNISDNFMDFFRLSNELTVVEMPAKEEWIGKSLRELNVRNVYKINIIAIVNKNDDNPDCFPNPDRPIQAGDVIIAAGRDEDIEHLKIK